MGTNYDFSGWATKANLLCSDGRTILKDAFKDCDGKTVPLVWMHGYREPEHVLGHALLENREEGVYAYCKFNDTEKAQHIKKSVIHGDITALSIYANQLREQNRNVFHGNIRELSLVLAGANPGALIDSIIAHSDDIDGEAVIYTGEEFTLSHSEDEENVVEVEEVEEVEKTEEEIQHSDSEEPEQSEETDDNETVQDVIDSMTEKQQTVMYVVVDTAVKKALEEAGVNPNSNNESVEHNEGGTTEMKHNVFENDNTIETRTLSHADGMAILENAKKSSVGSLKTAMEMYAEQNALQHGIDNIEALFPDYKDVKPGAPELIMNDSGWVSAVMKKVHKSPLSRIRTRQADARGLEADLRAKGYEKGKEKKYIGNIKLLSRTTDPQTIYIKDKLHRDDIIDITDFDVTNYIFGIMKAKMEEEVATAIMIGDGRDDGTEDKISEDHIRSIWNDDELYTIHRSVDMAAVKAAIQGTNSTANFGENYLYSEAMIQESLYAREEYKGKGRLDFFCTPHALNVMKLAKDINGRRLYKTTQDVALALDVDNIYTAEQFKDKIRTAADGKKYRLLGIFCNLSQYSLGSTKGGELTRFNQFDIDFNTEKYLLETRLSGASTAIKSAIVLEELVTED